MFFHGSNLDTNISPDMRKRQREFRKGLRQEPCGKRENGEQHLFIRQGKIVRSKARRHPIGDNHDAERKEESLVAKEEHGELQPSRKQKETEEKSSEGNSLETIDMHILPVELESIPGSEADCEADVALPGLP